MLDYYPLVWGHVAHNLPAALFEDIIDLQSSEASVALDVVVPDFSNTELLPRLVQDKRSELLLGVSEELPWPDEVDGRLSDFLVDLWQLSWVNTFIAEDNALDLVIVKELSEEADIKYALIYVLKDLFLERDIFVLFKYPVSTLPKLTKVGHWLMTLGHLSREIQANGSISQLLILALRFLAQQMIQHVLPFREGGQTELELLSKLPQDLAHQWVDSSWFH